jgi:hypothetical protein
MGPYCRGALPVNASEHPYSGTDKRSMALKFFLDSFSQAKRLLYVLRVCAGYAATPYYYKIKYIAASAEGMTKGMRKFFYSPGKIFRKELCLCA